MAQCLQFYTWCNYGNLGVGCYLYTDIKRSTPVSTGWVSDGANVYSVNSSGMITAITACSGCQPNGTFITSYCVDYDLYFTYADGNCGTYDSFSESNSLTCGYTGGGGGGCTIYQTYDYGWVTYTDCYGSYHYNDFVYPYTLLCVQLWEMGPAYQTDACTV